MLTRRQLERLDQEGYLVVENVLDPVSDLDPILQELSEILDQLITARLLEQNKLLQTFAQEDDKELFLSSSSASSFEERLTKIIECT